MNNRKYKTNPEILLEQGKEILKGNIDDDEYRLRVFAVNMVLNGTPASQVGACAGVTKATVTNWVRAVDENGFDALHTKPRPGRPSTLSKEQYDEIDKALQKDISGEDFKVWNGPNLSVYIKKKYGVQVSVRQCQRLLHALGYALIRPQVYPSKGSEDTLKREEFKKNARK